MIKTKIITTDYLVIGPGVAGLSSAITLAYGGAEVIVACKGACKESSSEYAQGGVAVVLNKHDSSELHFLDTMMAGKNMGNEKAVRILVEEGIDRVIELIDWGAKFDRDGDGFAMASEAAHSRKRILRADGDSTGKEIVLTLFNKVAATKNIKIVQNCFLLDLLIENGACKGALALDEITGEIFIIRAKGVVLTTGGAGQVYHKTTNPVVATGDGYAMAHRAGAKISDMEFVQFHPTSMFVDDERQFLISEAARGEGGLLRNVLHEPFMASYEPEAEMATRDRVSIAIYKEMEKTKTDFVYLDMTHKSASFLKKRFPGIFEKCKNYGFDISKDLIPVSPSAHFIMGGVVTDSEGHTSISNLFAAGETTCTGVHGANRLASNSLLEGLVFGARAGVAALESREAVDVTDCSYQPLSITKALDAGRLKEITYELKRLMWKNSGVVRNGSQLSFAAEKLTLWEEELEYVMPGRLSFEVKNMVTTAKLITLASLERQGSIGAHFRDDSKSASIAVHM